MNCKTLEEISAAMKIVEDIEQLALSDLGGIYAAKLAHRVRIITKLLEEQGYFDKTECDNVSILIKPMAD